MEISKINHINASILILTQMRLQANRKALQRCCISSSLRCFSQQIFKPVFKLPFYKSCPKKIIFGSLLGLSAIVYFTNDDFHNSVMHTYLTFGRVKVVAITTVKCFWYYKKALSKEFDNLEDRNKAISECHIKCADIALKALEKNGGIYIKLGQHISAMTYLLPKEWTSAMIPLQDQCPESTLEEIDMMFKTDLGKSIKEIFSSFDSTPIGSASLAQVHIATLKETGEKVAVKCQHPSLAEFVPLDILLTQTVFKLVGKVFPEYPLTWLSDELESSIYVELNFKNEADNARKTNDYFKNFQKYTALRIPEVKSASDRILILEYVGGSRLDNLKFMEEHHISKSEVSSCLLHIFNNMIFTPGVAVHCDPHGGNLAIRPKPKVFFNPQNPYNFEIILYDHGLYRQVSTQMRRDYAHFWLALLDKDRKAMELYAEKFAGITKKQFPIFAAAITGRDIETALNYDPTKVRDEKEIKNMKKLLTGDNLLIALMDILAHIPRVVLLILKTNDLTRNLDENLNNPLGPQRTFLILISYCFKTVYEERKEQISKSKSSWFVKCWNFFKSWIEFKERTSQLFVHDFMILFKNWFAHFLN